jgi:hypothetical protein
MKINFTKRTIYKPLLFLGKICKLSQRMAHKFMNKEQKKNVQTAFWAMGIMFILGLIFYFFDNKKEKEIEEKKDYSPEDLI